MNRKPHILKSKKITEARNPKRSSKCVRGYGVLLSMPRNSMSLFIKKIFLYITLLDFAILYPISLTNLVVEVGARHSHQILLSVRWQEIYKWIGVQAWARYMSMVGTAKVNPTSPRSCITIGDESGSWANFINHFYSVIHINITVKILHIRRQFYCCGIKKTFVNDHVIV